MRRARARGHEIRTERCEACRVFTPVADVVLGRDGRAYCVGCGAPREAPLEEVAVGWRAAVPLDRSARAVVAVVVGTVAVSWLAAFASQL